MTNAAMKEAFEALRPAEEFATLEQAARSRSEADWIVGMNATRAATIRLRSSFDGAVSLGRVQTPTLAIIARREEEIRAFKPEPYWLVDATFAAGPLAGGGAERRTARRRADGNGDEGRRDRRAHLPRPLPRGHQAADRERGGGGGDRRGVRGQARDDHEAREEKAERESADAVRPDDAAARGEHALRVLRPPHAVGGAAAVRGAQGADLPAHELALPDERHGRGDQADRRAGGRAGRVQRRPRST